MANNYLEFSEVIPHLTAEEETWLGSQLERVYVFADREYPEGDLPSDLDAADADWHGCRAWQDLEGSEPQDDPVGFAYEFNDDDEPDGWGRHLWLYADEGGDLERVAHLVQKFLRQFRPQDSWSLTYAITCSKPRVGEFGGGAVFVTADEVKWQNAHDFVETQSAAFRKKTAPGSTSSASAIQSYELVIGGPELRAQRRLLVRLAEGLHRGKRPQLDPDDAEPLEGLVNLTDAIAEQAADRYGLDCLLAVLGERIRVRAYEIEWDTDGEDPAALDLPSETVVEMDPGADISAGLADALSDAFGFCVFGCQFEVLQGSETGGAADPGRQETDREIRLPCFGIVLGLSYDPGSDKPGGTITSDLKDSEETLDAEFYNAAIDGIESLILGHACAGVDVESPAYVEGIETAVEATGNHYH